MNENFTKYANSFQTVISLGLGRISALLELMGNPQRGQRFVHVAGTNGKGSVCAFLEAIFAAEGFKVGKFTSPNLIRVNERITVGGKEITDGELNSLLERIGGLCSAVEKLTGEIPTQFEVWTAAAMAYFKQSNCDIVILEVGLGGEFDATNVIEESAVSVVTRIALDHCAYLGSSEAEVARAKCGIMKEGGVTVALRQSAEVNRVIKECAERKHNRLIFAEKPESCGTDGINEKFLLRGAELVCGLGGLHQLENAAVASEAALFLGVGEDALRTGLMTAKNPARMELLADGLLFDGAHNPNGAAALAENLDRYFPRVDQTVIFACMKDKDVVSSLKLLSSPRRSFVFTEVSGNPRSMGAEELKELAAEIGIRAVTAKNLGEAIKTARERGNLTVVCGSLYLYGELPEEFLN